MSSDTPPQSLAQSLPPTNEDTLGPYFPMVFCDDYRVDLSRRHAGLVVAAQGQAIVLRGRLLDRHGQLANGALLEFWQANAAGVYRNPASVCDASLDPAFDGFARMRTADGRFEIKTIKPGGWKKGKLKRAPNITLSLFSDGFTRIVTQIFFSDEPANQQDPLLLSLPATLRHRLVAQYDGRQADGSEVYTLDVITAGENETPFFDDSLCDDGDTHSGDRQGLGRTLEVGPTDNTSDQRTPRQALRLIPEELRESFVAYYEAVASPRRFESDMTRIAPGRPRACGEVIEVKGKVLDQHGRPLRHGRLEIWNANQHGRYTHIEDQTDLPLDANFLGHARIATDADGDYCFRTISPGCYLARADINRWRPKHIHISVLGGSSRLVTQMYFPNAQHNDSDPMRILMGDNFARNVGVEYAVAGDDITTGYRFDLVIGGRNASFFEDL